MGNHGRNRLLSGALLLAWISSSWALHPSQARMLVQFVERDDFKPVHTLKPSNVSEDCKRGIHRIISGRRFDDYAALDAFGKVVSGHVTGNNAWLGSYDLCLDIPDVHYSLALMQISWLLPVERQQNHSHDGKEVVMWGLCIPKNCSIKDTQNSIPVLANATLPLNKFNITHVRVHKSINYTKRDFDSGFIGTVVVFSLFGLLVILGTIVDGVEDYKKNRAPKLIHKMDANGSHLVDPQYTQPRHGVQSVSPGAHDWETPPTPERIRSLYFNSPGLFRQVICCFSILSNIRKLLSTKEGDASLSCLNGMRVITMFWVILGHVWLLTSFMGLTDNTRVLYQYPSQWTFQPVVNGYFAIDTFFFISGILVCYSTLNYMDKCKGRYPFHKFLFHRYWRLTPVMVMVILFYVNIFPHMGDGPLWFVVKQVTTDNCPEYWWTNILYINNFYPVKAADECLPWVWYLACDIQFFLFSPLILIFLHRETNTMKYLGFGVMALVLLVCFILRASLMTQLEDGMGPTPSMGIIVPPPRNANGTHEPPTQKYSSDVYVKPYTRVAPYLVGMMVAYFIQQLKGARKRISMITISLGWLVSVALAVVCIYITVLAYSVYHGDYLWNQGGKLVYGTFSKFAWALSLAWVVYACYHGYGGYVKDFLSWRVWVPLGRLTYAAYLIHPIVILWYLFTLQEPIHITDNVMSYLYFSVLGCTYFCAIGVLLVIELPLANIEQLLYKLFSCCAGCLCCGACQGNTYRNLEEPEHNHNSLEEEEVQPTSSN
ncbi:nose resistant to fluoxetine protein 6 isoform X2 [Lingula anatina]|uniref:Nose resistant to fluoxetine protein 6 isoform X1 n=1 Tax=Lingula anatina TaxID=7574 RepID=A0A1S3HVM1_LINAN|nr:nose resistant to fluoxetine protein 6 isoform X1 [Lingula anatina]XP_023930371.1 nose resistant to fluoxetine protein 6 isoform X2 [Lingula anatina]|eukprot:XP_013389109.1 nose resistant to fluoxetine protein 6 isoform X1 [Lingula anatina]